MLFPTTIINVKSVKKKIYTREQVEHQSTSPLISNTLNAYFLPPLISYPKKRLACQCLWCLHSTLLFPSPATAECPCIIQCHMCRARFHLGHKHSHMGRGGGGHTITGHTLDMQACDCCCCCGGCVVIMVLFLLSLLVIFCVPLLLYCISLMLFYVSLLLPCVSLLLLLLCVHDGVW